MSFATPKLVLLFLGIKMFLSTYNLFKNRCFDALTVTFWDRPSHDFPLIQFLFLWVSFYFWCWGLKFFSYELFNIFNLFMAVLDLRC